MKGADRYCAWCGAVIPARTRPAARPAGVSHGICAECLSETGEFPVRSDDDAATDYPPIGILRIDAAGVVREYRRDGSADLPLPAAEAYVGRNIREIAGAFGLPPEALAPGDPGSRTEDLIFRYDGLAVLIEVTAFERPEQQALFLVWRMIQ